MKIKRFLLALSLTVVIYVILTLPVLIHIFTYDVTYEVIGNKIITTETSMGFTYPDWLLMMVIPIVSSTLGNLISNRIFYKKIK